jgi:hypothetical protein
MKALVIKKAGEAALESSGFAREALASGKRLPIYSSRNWGDQQSSERRLNFSQAFNPLGSITGILIGFGCRTDAAGSAARPQGAGFYEAYLRCPGPGVNPRSPTVYGRVRVLDVCRNARKKVSSATTRNAMIDICTPRP